MLADSGFQKVFNINGGVSNLRISGVEDDCKLLTSRLAYQIISPQRAHQYQGGYFILDVRQDSAYKGIATQERKNAYGKFDGAVNIPLAALEQNLLLLPKGKGIFIVDENGAESAAAAEMLAAKGYANLAILFNGLEGYISEVPESARTKWKTVAPYHTINGQGLHELLTKNAAMVIDIRTSDEFNNLAKESFRNGGIIKGAVNIPYLEIDNQLSSLPMDKDQPIVVYSFSSTPEPFEAAKKLTNLGYKNVSVLLGGLFNLRWRAANIKGQSHLKDWVVNVPPDNR